MSRVSHEPPIAAYARTLSLRTASASSIPQKSPDSFTLEWILASHSVFVFGCFAFRIPYIVHNHESVFPSSSCSLADDRTPSCQWKNPTPAPAPSPTAFSTAGHANPMFLDASCLGLPRSQLDCGTLSAGPKPRRACHRVRPRYLPV
jgi:hypothetical protein